MIGERNLGELEQANGRLAATVVNRAGGSVTFREYDLLMETRLYSYPINWIAGWGLSKREWKANNDKMCAFAAVAMGLLRQTTVGYERIQRAGG